MMIDLQSILKQHPNCLNNRASFKSVLMDKYPTEKRMVNILTILFECGVANRIKTKKSIDANEMQALIAQAENEYGISGLYSQEAILVWAAAFDVTASAIKTPSITPLPKVEEKSVEQKPVVYVQGDVDDYDIVQKTDGYYITHFNGFEEESMTIPSLIDGKKIKGIAEDAFKGCVTVKDIRISEGIEAIENRAFKECKALEIVALPDTLRRIGSPSKEYGVGAFSETKLREIVVPQNVDFIGPYTFNYCSNLKKVVLSDNITTISYRAFNHCKCLTDIKLPSKLSVIGEEAFADSGIREIHIPMGTRKIMRSAFSNNPLTAAYIPPTIKEIGDANADSIFGDYTFGRNFTRHPDFTIFCSAGSAAMEYARKNNIKCAKAQF